MPNAAVRQAAVLLLLALAAADAPAQALRERLQQAREASRQPAARPPELPVGTRVLRDLAYGDDPRQRFDVYLPAKPLDAAPVILVVHGGGWANGNKDNPGLVDGKAGKWLPEGRVPFADARCFAVPVDAELPAAFWVALLDRLDRLR